MVDGEHAADVFMVTPEDKSPNPTQEVHNPALFHGSGTTRRYEAVSRSLSKPDLAGFVLHFVQEIEKLRPTPLTDSPAASTTVTSINQGLIATFTTPSDL